MSKVKWPSEDTINEMREKLSNSPASKPLPKDASPVERIKHQICREFVAYKNSSQTTQKVIAEKMGIDEALLSKILHYNVDEFTIDRLVKLLTVLRPKAKVKVEVA